MQNPFLGKARYYVQYRPKLPQQLFDFLVKQLELDSVSLRKQGRYLDAGCGTGMLTIPLSRYFYKTIAVDPNAEMLAEARNTAEKSGIKDIEWIQDCIENLSVTLDKFDLITIANAFHWMDQSKVTPWILEHLNAHRYLVLIGSYNIIESMIKAKTPWQGELWRVLKSWFTQEIEDRYKDIKYKLDWQEALAAYPFASVNAYQIHEVRVWTTETLLGFVYSLSFCSRERLGDRAPQFEQVVKETLLRINPENHFVEDNQISVIVAEK